MRDYQVCVKYLASNGIRGRLGSPQALIFCHMGVLRRTALIVSQGLSKCLYLKKKCFRADEIQWMKGSHEEHIQMQCTSERFLIKFPCSHKFKLDNC